MKQLIVALLLLITISGFSQINQIQVLSSERIFGKCFVDSSVVKGFEYIFSDRIHETFLDTTTGLLTVQLRGLSKNKKWLNNTGDIVQYDLNNQKILWSKKITYESSSLQQFSKTAIYTVANKSYCLDVNTGNELWEVKNNIYFVDPIDNIGIGYKFSSFNGNSNELEGIDLKNGNVVWKRDLSREYGWNNVSYLNDSTIIVVAAGLHAINIRNGKGWDYNTITGKMDYTGTVAANAAGVAVGLLTGAFVMSSGHNLVRDLVSNTLTDSSSFYFASQEQLVKIDKHSGEIAWKVSFFNDLVSKSSIFMNDSVIFMINKGMAFMGSRQLDFGKPFLAAFDRKSGKQIFFSLINVNKDPILSYQIQNREIFLVFKNRIAKYSMENGDMLANKDIPKENFGDLDYFVGDQVFITTQNGDLKSLPQSDSTKVFVFTSLGKTLSIDIELNVTKTFEYDALSIYYLRTAGLKFIAKEKKSLIVNNTGQRIGEIDASSNAFMIDNTLYDTQDRSFRTIGLREIIKSK